MKKLPSDPELACFDTVDSSIVCPETSNQNLNKF